MKDRAHKSVQQNTFISFAFSAVAGLFTQIVYYPISIISDRIGTHPDKIRTRSQLKSVILAEHQYPDIYQRMRSFYQGFWLHEIHKIGSRSFKYGCQPFVSAQLRHLLPINGNNQAVKEIAVEGFAGAVTTILQLAVFYPLDTIKHKRINGNIAPLSTLVKEEKLNLYSGVELAVLNKVV